MVREHDNGLPLTAIDQYMHQVRLIPHMTDEEEERLLLCIASGVDARQARDRMVEGYQYMIVNLARRYARNCHHLDVLDLAQEGSEGFLRAVEKFDVNMGMASFKTLAFAWVRGSMLMAYWRYERALRIPLNKVRAMRCFMPSLLLMQLVGVSRPGCFVMRASETDGGSMMFEAALYPPEWCAIATPARCRNHWHVCH